MASLVAYIVPKDAMPASADLRAHLAETLPDYMVPAAFVAIAAMPLNANGKLDRAALPDPGVLDAGETPIAPRTPNEQLIATLFAEILGTHDVNANTNFFHKGGDSISSLRLVARARAHGLSFTPRDVFRHQTITGLALAATPVRQQAEESILPGSSLPATPIVRWLQGRGPSTHFSQAIVLNVPSDLTVSTLAWMLDVLEARHDALRLRLNADWTLDVLPSEPGRFRDAIILLPRDADLSDAMHDAAARLQPEEGRLLEARLLSLPDASARQLLLVVHHLAVDGVSWRILAGELAALAKGGAGERERISLPPSGSFRIWAHRLVAQASETDVASTLPYWRNIQSAPSLSLASGPLDPKRDVVGAAEKMYFTLNPAETSALLETVPGRLKLRINDILLAALLVAARAVNGTASGALRIDLEGHGREDVIPGYDAGAVVGWFTSLFPVLLDGPPVTSDDGPRQLLRAVKETLGAIPLKGVSYGMLRYLNDVAGESLADAPTPDVGFNYLGRFSEGAGPWQPAQDHPALRVVRDPSMALAHAVEILARVVSSAHGATFSVELAWAPAIVASDVVKRLGAEWRKAARAIIALADRDSARPILIPADMPLVQITRDDLDVIIARVPHLEDILPLTPLQDGLLFHALYDEKGHDAYIVQLVAKLGGPVDGERLRAACDALVARHQALRASFEHHGFERPVQVVSSTLGLLWEERTIADAAEEQAWLVADQADRFDPSQPPLIRFALLRRRDDAPRLVITLHHLMLDGWSIPLVTRDLVALYEGHALPPPVPHGRFMEWLGIQDKTAEIAHWTSALASVPPLTRLIEDTGNAALMVPAVARASLTEAETSALAARSAALHVTPSVIVQAAWAILLARLTRQSATAFGVTISGRPPELAGSEQIVGLLINTLPLQITVDGGATVAALCHAVRDRMGTLLAHPNAPLRDLRRIAGQGELFDTLVVYESYPNRDSSRAASGLRIDHIEGHETSHYPLSLLALPGKKLEFRLNYRVDLFEAGVGEEILKRLLRLIRGICSDPDQVVDRLAAMPPSEQKTALLTGADPAPFRDAIARFRAQAAAHSRDVAVEDGEIRISFGDLDRWSDAIALRLAGRGVGPEHRVALLFERGAPLVAALLGVLKTGAAFVPLDPGQPPQRIRALIAEAAVGVTLAAPACAGHAEIPGCLTIDGAEFGAPFPSVVPLPETCAYILFTSGSTGTPKGVAVTHRGLSNYAAWGIAHYGLGHGDGAAVTTSIAFDATMTSLILPLLAGERVVMLDESRQFDLLASRHETFSLLKVTPAQVSLLAGMLPADRVAKLARRLVIGGEALTADALAPWRRSAPDMELFNEYGPTETVVGCVVYRVQTGDPETGGVAIGTPIAGTRLLVLDHSLQPVPPGMPGELYIEGEGLARGYFGRPALTAERFVAAPWCGPGRRMYRTGDLVRRRSDGVLIFLGRTDDQIKVRGHRIEPTEIETVLLSLPDVERALVLKRDDREGRQRLVAYVVAPEPPVDWRKLLSLKLPDYMVPDDLVAVGALPLTRNGKIDRVALPEFGQQDRSFVAPSTPVEKVLAELVSKLLKVEHVGAADSFFALGGDSILSIQLVSRLRRAGYVLKPQEIFELQTIKALAAVARPAKPATRASASGIGSFEPTPIMHWLRRRGGPIGRYAQSLLVDLPSGTGRDDAAAVLNGLWQVHDVLRAKLVVGEGGQWNFVVPAADAFPPPMLSSKTIASDSYAEQIEQERNNLAAMLEPEHGIMLQATWFDGDGRSALLLCLHHLVSDGVSLRIIAQDVEDLVGRRPVEPPATPFRSYALAHVGAAPSHLPELPYWVRQLDPSGAFMPDARLDRTHDVFGTRRIVRKALPTELTKALLGPVPEAFYASIDDILLTALGMAVARWRNGRERIHGNRPLLVGLEGHGRNQAAFDVTRTVGWFTVMHPLSLSIESSSDDESERIRDAVLAVKEQRRQVPGDGNGYGLLRALADMGNGDAAILRDTTEPQILFNYLGRSSGALDGFGATADAALPLAHILTVNAMTIDRSSEAEIVADWSFAPRLVAECEVAAIADYWDEALLAIADAVKAGHGGHSPSDFPLVSLTQAQVTALCRAVPDAEGFLPLAPLQEGLLFHARYDGAASPLYVSQLVLELDGTLDVDRLRAAATLLLARHDSLRATFLDTNDARPVQAIRRGLVPGWQVLDRSASHYETRQDAMRLVMDQDRAAGFRLDSADPLARFCLVRHGDEQFSLLCTFHHIIVDGWSMPNIINDLMAFHADPLVELPAPSRRADFARWLVHQDRPAALQAWVEALSGLDGPVRLAAAPAQGDGPRVHFRLRLAPETNAALVALTRAEGITFNTVIQAVWAILLGRLTRRNDVVFGITIGGRPAELPGIETSVGLFINTLPLRATIRQDESIGAFLRGVQASQVALLPHQHVGLTEIQRALGLGELFDTLLAYESYPLDHAALGRPAGGLSVSRIWSDDVAHYPLSIVVVPKEQLELRFNARTDIIPEGTARSIADRFVALLDDLSRRPTVVVGALGQSLTRTLALPTLPMSDANIPGVFDRQAARRGDAVAIIHGSRRLTYTELEIAANRLAHHLIKSGLRLDRPTVVIVPRGPSQVIAMLAILKAGGFYLPIDEALPAARVADIMAEARVALAIILAHNVSALPLDVAAVAIDDAVTAAAITSQSARAPEIRIHSLAPAYVIYTSGSTGRPKGVTVTHANVLRLFAATRQFAFDDRDCWTLFHSAAFDFSVWEIWGALLHGGRLVIVPWETSRDPSDFFDLLVAERVTVLNQTPSAFYELANAAKTKTLSGARLKLRLVVFGGEALDQARLEPWFDQFGTKSPRLVNMYGITETTVHVSHLSLPAPSGGGGSPIGHPIEDLRIRLLDTALQDVPNGVIGEIFVGGGGLARGYLGRPDLTAERFVAEPGGEPGERLYRTGDLARRSEDGSLVYVGRSDHQVKIRGFRIELGEIESRLSRVEGVKQAAVAVRENAGGHRQLVAYAVLDGLAPRDASSLRTALAAYLPDYMMPSSFVLLPHMPLTRNGKLDRAALPAPDRASSPGQRGPRDEREEMLCGLFREVLNLPSVGVADEFFALGGDSLLAMRLIGLLRARSNIICSIRTLFDNPTVESLATASGQADVVADPLERLIALRATGTRPRLFCIHPGGGLSWVYARLMRHLPADQPIHALQARGFASGDDLPDTIESMAADYLAAMRSVQPNGPYHLLGWSFGGLVAYAIAARLEQEGEMPGVVALLDAYPVRGAGQSMPLDDDELLDDQLQMIGAIVPPRREAPLRDTLLADRGVLSSLRPRDIDALVRITRNNVKMATGWDPPRLRGDLDLFIANAGLAPPFDWTTRVDGIVHRHLIACRHGDMMKPVPLTTICGGLEKALRHKNAERMRK
ncbi:MAG: amino acid adenylation domain-containing protein [Beijerinckiaceae bacterium]|nr:amino acid adenylation domain-containing protein [Beijerinckiaceae bacterium]